MTGRQDHEGGGVSEVVDRAPLARRLSVHDGAVLGPEAASLLNEGIEGFHQLGCVARCDRRRAPFLKVPFQSMPDVAQVDLEEYETLDKPPAGKSGKVDPVGLHRRCLDEPQGVVRDQLAKVRIVLRLLAYETIMQFHDVPSGVCTGPNGRNHSVNKCAVSTAIFSPLAARQCDGPDQCGCRGQASDRIPALPARQEFHEFAPLAYISAQEGGFVHPGVTVGRGDGASPSQPKRHSEDDRPAESGEGLGIDFKEQEQAHVAALQVNGHRSVGHVRTPQRALCGHDLGGGTKQPPFSRKPNGRRASRPANRGLRHLGGPTTHTAGAA